MSIPLFVDGETELDAATLNRLVNAANGSASYPIALAGIEGALGEAGIRNAGVGVVYAADDGVVADGITDNRPAMQDAIDRALSGNNPASGVARIELPAGPIALDGPLEFPFLAGLEMVGKGKAISYFVQYADNMPILSFVADPYSHTIRLADFGLFYANQQVSGATGANCILIGGDANAQPSNLIFERLYFHKSYRGVYADTSAGIAAPWGMVLRDLWFSSLQGSAIRAADAWGKPNVLAQNIFIDNGSSGPAAPDEAAIHLVATEVMFQNLDIEHWNATQVYVSGTSAPTIFDNYHMENSTWIGTGDLNLNYIADGGFIARRVSFDGTVNKPSGNTYVFRGDGGAGALCVLDGIFSTATLTSGNCYPVRLTNGVDGYVRGVTGSGWTATPINHGDSASVANLIQSDEYTFIPTKAGPPTDADIPVDKDGAQIVDTTNHRLYVREGGAWKYVSLT